MKRKNFANKMPINGLFNECSICLDRLIFKRKKLGCGHAFHRRCIALALKTRNECPICSAFVFNEHESNLLTSKAKFNPNSLSSERSMVVLREAIRRDKSSDLVRLITAQYDPSRLVYEFIAEKDVPALKAVIASRMLNWHSTVNDKTIVEAALNSDDANVIDVVLEAASVKKKRLYPQL